MKIRLFVTAAILGTALTAGGPAHASQIAWTPDTAAPTGELSANIHSADWRGDRRWERRANRRAERRAHRRAERRAARRAERRAARRWERRREFLRQERRREARRYRRHNGYAYSPRGRAYGYRRGDYLPQRRYRVVDNWYDYGWRRPYRGERYVHVDGRYFLIQAATGLIIAALLY